MGKFVLDSQTTTIIRVDRTRTNRNNQRPVKMLRVTLEDVEMVGSALDALKPALSKASDIFTYFNLPKLFYAWYHAGKHSPIQALPTTPSQQLIGYSFFSSSDLSTLQELARRWWGSWVTEYVWNVALSDNCELIFDFEHESGAQSTFQNSVWDCTDIEASVTDLCITTKDDFGDQNARLHIYERGTEIIIDLTLASPSSKLIKPFYESFEKLEGLVGPMRFVRTMNTVGYIIPKGSSVVLVDTPYLSVTRDGMTATTISLNELYAGSTEWSDDECENVLCPFGEFEMFKLLMTPEDADLLEKYSDDMPNPINEARKRYNQVAAVLGPNFFDLISH